MKTALLLALTTFFSVTAIAQPAPDTLWTRTYGGSDYEWCNSIEQTYDGGYVLAGCSNSFGLNIRDFWLVKTDENGDSLWSRTYGRTEADECLSIKQTSDSGFVLAGWSLSSIHGGSYDFLIVKTDAAGDTSWTRVYDFGETDICYSVTQTMDGGYAMAGSGYVAGANTQMRLTKIDADGNSEWDRFYLRNYSSYCYAAQETSDGGFILAGYTSGSLATDTYDFYLVKTDCQGDTLWTRVYGGDEADNASSICQTSDGGYIVSGNTNSFGDGTPDYTNVWLIKTDANGDSMWSRCYGGDRNEFCHSVLQTTDGGYVLAGDILPNGNLHYDAWLIKTDANGDSLWSLIIGGDGDDGCSAIVETAENSYALAANTRSLGASLDYNFWLIKVGIDEQSHEPVSISQPQQFTLYPCFPNPFNASTQITYELPNPEQVSLIVYNLLGGQVATLIDDLQTAGTHTLTFDGSNLSSGIYFIRLATSCQTATSKIVLLK